MGLTVTMVRPEMQADQTAVHSTSKQICCRAGCYCGVP